MNAKKEGRNEMKWNLPEMGGGFKDESNMWGVDEVVVLGPNPIPIPSV